MKPNFTINELKNSPKGSFFQLECETCQKVFTLQKKFIYSKVRDASFIIEKVKGLKYCSKQCADIARYDRITVDCHYCLEPVTRERRAMTRVTEFSFCNQICFKAYTKQQRLSKIVTVECAACHKMFERSKRKVKKNNFCSSYCAENNCNLFLKLFKRSRPEKYFEERLIELYPDLSFSFNNRKVLGSLELDIYIESLRLAFEINGVTHYKPIFGKECLERQEGRDERKKIQCAEKDIQIEPIDISTLKYTTPKYMDEYLSQIISFIDARIILQCPQNSSSSIPS